MWGKLYVGTNRITQSDPRKGYLSPELAIGWKVGQYAAEFFDGLENITVIADNNNDALIALRQQMRNQGQPQQLVTISDKNPPGIFSLTTGVPALYSPSA